jgi:outer membrane lipoprotein-sorting protein
MTNFLRHASHKALLFVAVAFVAVLAAGTALAAGALSGSGAKPPAKPLDAAVHDALTAAPVTGVTARIRFTNKLVGSTNLQGHGMGANPLIAGATGRLWAAPDGRLRLELQADRGDAELTSDGTTASFYDTSSNTLYRMTLPQHKDKTDGGKAPPTLKEIQDGIAKLAQSAGISGAQPSNVAGQPAYTVRLSPKKDGGMVGGAELAWDAATGTPLRAAIYAAGASKPVLELTATDVSFGPVDASAFGTHAPADAKVVKVATPSQGGAGHDGKDAHSSSFKAIAPGTLAGMTRAHVRPVHDGALVIYGQGLGGIAVLEQPASKPDAAAAAPAPGDRHHSGPALPTVTIGGAQAQELATALGTVVRFERNGVQYTVAGSVPKAVAEAAAKAL